MPNTVTRSGQSTTLDVVNLIIGICLALSPWVVGYAATVPAAWNAWLVGAAIALIAIGALVAFAEWEEWLNLLLGIWLIVSPWILGFSAMGPPTIIQVVAGLIVAILAAIELWMVRNRPMTTA